MMIKNYREKIEFYIWEHQQNTEVINKLKNITATFYKNDNGDLPNAVIDIWKTGIKRLGVNKTNYNKIKKAGKYKYTF